MRKNGFDSCMVHHLRFNYLRNTNKEDALGMSYGKARAKLIKSIMFKSVCDAGNNSCFHCGFPMTLETISIEHKESWLRSANPIEKFFDLDNISFSHEVCNYKAAHKTRVYYTQEERRSKWSDSKRRNYSTEKRQKKFQTTGY